VRAAIVVRNVWVVRANGERDGRFLLLWLGLLPWLHGETERVKAGRPLPKLPNDLYFTSFVRGARPSLQTATNRRIELGLATEF